jgi:hypothetical protein
MFVFYVRVVCLKCDQNREFGLRGVVEDVANLPDSLKSIRERFGSPLLGGWKSIRCELYRQSESERMVYSC